MSISRLGGLLEQIITSPSEHSRAASTGVNVHITEWCQSNLSLNPKASCHSHGRTAQLFHSPVDPDRLCAAKCQHQQCALVSEPVNFTHSLSFVCLYDCFRAHPHTKPVHARAAQNEASAPREKNSDGASAGLILQRTDLFN